MEIIVASLLTFLLGTAALSNVSHIGKPREPLTPRLAQGVVLINTLFLVAVWYLALA